jgi:aspartyl-tRNA(Asn)/glutamyl-tRNA(Gln) amidotransferase subunit C
LLEELIQVKITDTQILHVAALARLKLDPDEVERFRGELDSILDYMDMLSEVDTSGMPPMHHPLPMANVFRPDEARPGQGLLDALLNAPVHEDGYVAVPKVIE